MGEDDGCPDQCPLPGTVAGPVTYENNFGGPLSLTGAPLWEAVPGPAAPDIHVGSAYCIWFNPNTTGYGTTAAISSLTNNFGIECWVNPNGTTGSQCLAYNGDPTASGWGLYLTNGTYRGLLGNAAFVGSAAATAGVWTHLALVIDNGTATFYVNGAAVGELDAKQRGRHFRRGRQAVR